uniref:MRG domain-containing protein n=1 Tax=Attheya septentrionalis TaxID=420275 RepID=A0A7S2XKG5_9STRA|mmetsp:Transcript_14488/g.26291  ORF Transcript_14488/g.26291 Transcript_14488/m.26291 type:complete len:379 (+) Transcript_14488:69-1205(+)|eukprot:CAMPEP_0198284976 /NCGR_PEP_ID=MMETSP1449-20131203/4314_1 /TAXON_ID=420275 /ORGANISM="Attheya septentrionalis, Strain CCMP2084" /LENGTH=378 /DNA_ID=CAMNT_0043982201 /DNA_START=43 /DNA_END=1179 /DNA_ORIENTATION=+
MDSNADEQVASSESDEDEDLDFAEPRYQIGQKIYARDGKSGIYESVVKKVESRPGVEGWSYRYWVHYLGWNSRWDRWIAQEDLLDDTDENRALSLKASEEQRQISSTKKRKREETLEKKRQKKKDSSLLVAISKTTSRNILSLEDYCQIPFTLKTIMLDDRSALSSESDHLISEDDLLPWQPNRLVHSLPAAVTIQMVLDKFVKRTKKDAAAKVTITPNMKSTKQKTENESDKEDEDEEARMAAARRIVKTAEKDAQEFVGILANLFNEALPVLLLYHEERYQHLSIVNETMRDHEPVDFYGCEHFLRLFVRLPILWNAVLGGSTIEVQQFGEQIASLLVFLQKHHNSCFRAQYRPPTRNEMTPSEKVTQDNLNELGS